MQKLRVSGLDVVSIEGAPTLMRVCDCNVMVVLPTTWFRFTIQFWSGIMLPIKRVGNELMTVAPTVVLAIGSSSHLCFLHGHSLDIFLFKPYMPDKYFQNCLKQFIPIH